MCNYKVTDDLFEIKQTNCYNKILNLSVKSSIEAIDGITEYMAVMYEETVEKGVADGVLHEETVAELEKYSYDLNRGLEYIVENQIDCIEAMKVQASDISKKYPEVYEFKQQENLFEEATNLSKNKYYACLTYGDVKFRSAFLARCAPNASADRNAAMESVSEEVDKDIEAFLS